MTDRIGETKEIVDKTTAMNNAMNRLHELREILDYITIGKEKRTGQREVITKITIEADYRKVVVNIADACPDLADRLRDMIEAEDTRLNDIRLEFVAEVNDKWGGLTASPKPREPDRIRLRPVNLEEDAT